ncbi:MAG: DNA alkylation repair protein [Actinomycetota bacterium]|nr:DNA alkylation repair protein [Actinomycetota bacterium]
MSVNKIKSELRSLSDPKRKKFLPAFFKTEKGGYGEGDKFIGVTVPNIRKIAKKYKSIDEKSLKDLLYSQWHEERFCAWIIVLDRYKKSADKKFWYEFSLKHIKQLNNWDLVDIVTPNLFGDYLLDKPDKQIISWSKSDSLWIRRVAIMATWPRIKANMFSTTLKISEKYIRDQEDLIHKATGWMLRELGKRDESILLKFMDKHHEDMPRIMVSYALEKTSKEKKEKYRKIKK